MYYKNTKNNSSHMTRCDYDAVFYRVFCVTLLAIAFTFTVILTNVFIDIDGLLASKHKTRMAESIIQDNVIRDEFTSETTDNDDINYGDNDEMYRTKRAIETQSFLFHIKHPKIKNVLANRLSTLLEELDAEEAVDPKPIDKKPTIEPPKDVEFVDIAKIAEDEKKRKVNKSDDLLHLTMHNILLQGILGHMDLNDVYKKVHSLMSNLNDSHDKKDSGTLKSKPVEEEKEIEPTTSIPEPLEKQFFDEMVNCNELQEQIEATTTVKAEIKTHSPVQATPSVEIKTIIDIKTTGTDEPMDNETKNLKENVKGIIEIIYNGKKIDFMRPDTTMTPKPKPKRNPTARPVAVKTKTITPETTTTKVRNDYRRIPKPYLDKFIDEYFKHFPQYTKDSTEIKENYATKRLKRHIKIKYENDDISQDKNPKKKKTEDDELYVEIETHFDSKGMKGEKKKRLIRNLIEKIQKAIHSDMDGKLISEGKTKHKMKRKQIHFRKRLQDPLEHNNRNALINKSTNPHSNIVHRQLNPISKIVPLQESSPLIGDKSGEDWKKSFIGPVFLTSTKSINSAEMGELDVDYSKVLDVNGIPQRLQKPLNTEFSEETVNTNSYYDVGKMKFFIKDIDGSGFSVGFNQYVDEPPDADTMKLFTGLENVIKTYHQNYDIPAEVISTTEATVNPGEKPTDLPPPNTDHLIVRRSIDKKRDYHSNEYKIIFDKNFLPYNNYRDIFQSKKYKTNMEFSSKKHMNELPLIVDENIFEKNLKPAEIFGLANLFERKKRSMNVKKISNLKSKIKLNRYLNTKAMSTKRIFLNKKRNKRQINKIRIIATDLPHLSKHSDENVFVVSDENVFADRAIVKEVESSGEHEKPEEAEYIPYQAEENLTPTYVTKIFDGRSRHNPLMSKYPHIFMEEISRSREEYIPDNALLFGKLPGLGKLNTINQNHDPEKAEEKIIEEHISTPNVTELPKVLKEQEIVNALMAPTPKANYKVTVKIVPKNMTGLNSGFKEIHTSINKRFNKNGLLYSSLVNVSEISKVVKINRSNDIDNREADSYLAKKVKDQQEKMQLLLKQHAKHINEQLSRLNEEKTNLESMLDSENITDIHFLDYEDLTIPSDKTLKAGKEVKEEESAKVDEESSKETETTVTSQKTTEETTTITTTTTTTTVAPKTTISPTFTDTVKKNIISTIERNGNLTDQILKKIDQNTEILQQFLKKLTEKIQLTAMTSTTTTTETPRTAAKEEQKIPNFDINSFPAEWANQFNQNVVIRKNDSHISIPFVYAYQQPIPNKNNGIPPVASVIYHGHIHTNTIHPKDVPLSQEKDKVNIVTKVVEPINPNNQSRFFIDELENDYKVIQVGDVKKNRDYNMVNINNTMT